MSFNNNTVGPTGSTIGIENLQRIRPLGDSGRQNRENPRRRPKPRPGLVDSETDMEGPVYTPDGHVEGDEHGVRLDISA